MISLNANLLSPGCDAQEQHQAAAKQGSPFYAEPADSLSQAAAPPPKRLPGRNLVPVTQRHSNPPALLGTERAVEDANGERGCLVV